MDTDFNPNANNTSHPGYLLLFRGAEDWDLRLSDEELKQTMDRVDAWFGKLLEAGRVRGGHTLHREGSLISAGREHTITDGPHAEAKEVIGGVLHLYVPTMDDAVAIARACPMLQQGGLIEVRPVAEECPVTRRVRERLGRVALV